MTTNQPTAALRRIAQLAAAMAAANPDAAEALAAALATEAAARKQPQGFGIEIRWNSVTEQIELRSG